MCDSHQPLNGADSCIWHHPTDSHTTEEFLADAALHGHTVSYDLSDGPMDGPPVPTFPVWPTRAANGGWDSPEVPRSARAGDRGGE